MPHVNFIHEYNAFMEYARDHKLPGNERTLWHALFYIMNSRAEKGVFPDHAIPIDNREILLNCGMKETAMAAARGRLKERGLIEYIPGFKNQRNPQIRLNYLTVPRRSYPQDNAQDDDSYPVKRATTGGNTGGNMGGNTGNITPNQRSDGLNTLLLKQAREELAVIMRRLSGSMQNYVHWLAEMDSDPLILAEFARLLESDRFSRDQLREALTLVQSKHERGKVPHPFAYLKAVLIDWERHDVCAIAEIADHLSYEPEPTGAYACQFYDDEKGWD